MKIYQLVSNKTLLNKHERISKGKSPSIAMRFGRNGIITRSFTSNNSNNAIDNKNSNNSKPIFEEVPYYLNIKFLRYWI